ncbi:MAG TPA: RNA polymerase sigma factor RpoE, partial [Peptococcaceae bacterium]|nr:RNA polymerase sigma factor RpoE [Peptococcaceae bacterium]
QAIPIPFDETTVAADQRFSPESISEAKDIKQIVEEAVASLPWEYRTAIVLRHFQDLSYKEIASTLELPLNTVKTRIRWGRLMLREILDPLLEQRSDDR